MLAIRYMSKEERTHYPGAAAAPLTDQDAACRLIYREQQLCFQLITRMLIAPCSAEQPKVTFGFLSKYNKFCGKRLDE